MSLTAPFPYYGGKSRWGDLVWSHFGKPFTYIEPFAGSLAVLLANPHPAHREIVCDTHGAICNFWRAIKAEPDLVAYYSSHPTIHQDLTARHRWLVDYFTENHMRFEADPDYYDCKAAGWWCWGVSNWIGGNFCDYMKSIPTISAQRPTAQGQGVQAQVSKWTSDKRPLVHSYGNGFGTNAQTHPDKRPLVKDTNRGQGTSAQIHDKRPKVERNDSGAGVSAQKKNQIPHVNHEKGGRGINAQKDQIPQVHDEHGGSGVQAQKVSPESRRPHVHLRHGGQGTNAQRTFDKIPWVHHAGSGRGSNAQTHLESVTGRMIELAERLFRVIVLNRSWESAVTNVMLGSTHKDQICIFLDPPYITDQRVSTLYHSDAEGDSDHVAKTSYDWAVKHGEKYRIAYCCHEGDFPVPDGWEPHVKSFAGVHQSKKESAKNDLIMFSPSCKDAETMPLFAE